MRSLCRMSSDNLLSPVYDLYDPLLCLFLFRFSLCTILISDFFCFVVESVNMYVT